MIEMTFLKELMLIRQASQKSVILVAIDTFQIKSLNLKHMYVTDNLLKMHMNLSNIFILIIKMSIITVLLLELVKPKL